MDRLVLFHDGPVLREGWWDPPRSAVSLERLESPVAAPASLVSGSAGMPSRSERLDYARRLLLENGLALSEVAARTGIHPTTLFRWRKNRETGSRSTTRIVLEIPSPGEF